VRVFVTDSGRPPTAVGIAVTLNFWERETPTAS